MQSLLTNLMKIASKYGGQNATIKRERRTLVRTIMAMQVNFIDEKNLHALESN